MATQTSNPEREVPTRRISFEEALRDLPKHFAAEGDLVASHLMASLSSVFPDGEDFFVRSVRAYRDKITDPELKRQVNGFIGQEAIHGREHRAFNDRLHELGYPVKRFERFTRKGLAIRSKLAPASSNLAATAALEHFTATFAELILENDEARAMIGDPTVTEVFMWHALEESEHKAVAFDVYKISGGSERMRTFTMNAMTFGFLAGMLIQTTISVLSDREAYRRGVLRKSLKHCLRSPFFDKALWHKLRDYNRPDFHPDDYDTDELVATWRAKFFGEEGSLNAKLAGPVAA